MSGPLADVRVVELGGLGPAKYAAMLLADLGADVVRIDRPGGPPTGHDQVLRRGRPSVVVDLKDAAAVGLVLDLVARADALLEGFRPGVAERLGLGPDACLARNPRLAYCRITGWGQDGPLAATAGHDINYIALSGLLDTIGRAGAPPTVPHAIAGDLAGGGLFAALGIVSAVLQARASGRGQVVDAAVVDGASALLGAVRGMDAVGAWSGGRGTNLHDGGAPFYGVYATADDRYLAVGALEDVFYERFVTTLGLEPTTLPDRANPVNWAGLRARFAAVLAGRTRDEWTARFAAVDACVTPVLDRHEAADHPHLVARQATAAVDGVVHPAPAPRFAVTPTVPPGVAAARRAYGTLGDVRAAWEVRT